MSIPRPEDFRIRQIQPTMNEEQVKKILGIKDFRHLSKQKVLRFMSSIQYMNPEVAKAIVEQFPEMASLTLGIVQEARQGLGKIIDANRESSADVARSIDKYLDSLFEEFQKEGITTEERALVMKEIDHQLERKAQLDRENKAFYLKVAGIIAGFAGTVTLAAFSVVGTNSGADLGSSDDWPDAA